MFHRQRPQQQSIDQAKCAGTSPDRQRQRHDGRERRHLVSLQLPPAEDDIGAKRIEPPDHLDAVTRFTLHQHPAQCASSLLRIAPLFDRLGDVRFKLLRDLAV